MEVRGGLHGGSMALRGGLHGRPWRSVEVSMEVRGGSMGLRGGLHGGPWSSVEVSTEAHGGLHGGSWKLMELRGGLHGVPDNVGRRCYRGTSGLLRARFGDLFSPSAMGRRVCNSRDPVLCARVLLLHNVFRKSEHNCLTSYWYTAAILASFFLIPVFKEVL